MAKRKKPKGLAVDKVKILRFGTGRRYDLQETISVSTQQYSADEPMEHQLHIYTGFTGLVMNWTPAELKKFKKFVASL